jgi:hypothetical protein
VPVYVSECIKGESKVVVPARQATQPGGTGSLESTHGLVKSLKIRALYSTSFLR